MKKLALAICFTLLALAVCASAEDMTGKWTGQMAGMGGGDPMTLTFTFKQEGAKLSGSVQGSMGDPMAFTDGKVEGNKFTFTIAFEGGGGSMKVKHEGTITGDEIKMTSKFEGGDFPGGGPNEITLKRAK
jgi:hypothetical protein